MKRTITIEVEVKDEQEYAKVIARATSNPEVIAWAATSPTPLVRQEVERLTGIPASPWTWGASAKKVLKKVEARTK